MNSQKASYVEYEPSSYLKKYVDCYWSYYTESPLYLIHENPIIPDGCVDIIFDLNITTQSQCFIVGAMTKPIISLKNDLFGIRFKPGVATSIINSPINEMTDHIIDIRKIKNSKTESLAEILQNKKSSQEKVSFLNSVFSKVISSQSLIEDETEYALSLIKQASGKCSVKEISERVGWSRQHLTRKFLKHTGLTPKFYSQVVRVNSLIHRYNSSAKHSWGYLAQTCGYYDQSHMINEFKNITGVTPQIFLNNSQMFHTSNT